MSDAASLSDAEQRKWLQIGVAALVAVLLLVALIGCSSSSSSSAHGAGYDNGYTAGLFAARQGGGFTDQDVCSTEAHYNETSGKPTADFYEGCIAGFHSTPGKGNS